MPQTLIDKRQLDISIFPNISYVDRGSTTSFNLPPITGSGDEYVFILTDNSFIDFDINANGIDLIDNPFSPSVAPSESTVTLLIPGETLHLKDDGTGWRNVSYSGNFAAVQVDLQMTSTQNITVAGGLTTIQFDNPISNPTGWFDPVTNFDFTPLVAGQYLVIVKGLFLSGTNSEMVIGSRKSGGILEREFLTTPNVATISAIKDIVELDGITDSVDFYAESRDATRTLLSGNTGTKASIRLIQRI